MGNPDDDKTTINVKSVSAKAWERAKASATRQGESMGAWLSRAINQLADLEARGPRELALLPANPVANLTGQTGNLVPSGPRDVVRLSANPVANLNEKMGNPRPAAPMSPDDLARLLQGMAALSSATGVPPPKTDIRLAYGLADEMVRDARGIPRKAPRSGKAIGKAAGQSLLENGKAEGPSS